jgi:hypothetical protein
VIIPEGEEPSVISGDLADIMESLYELQANKSSNSTIVYAFYGLKASFTPPPFRYLVWPGGQYRTALFELRQDDDEQHDKAVFGRSDKLPIKEDVVSESEPALMPVKNSRPARRSGAIGDWSGEDADEDTWDDPIGPASNDDDDDIDDVFNDDDDD